MQWLRSFFLFFWQVAIKIMVKDELGVSFTYLSCYNSIIVQAGAKYTALYVHVCSFVSTCMCALLCSFVRTCMWALLSALYVHVYVNSFKIMNPIWNAVWLASSVQRNQSSQAVASSAHQPAVPSDRDRTDYLFSNWGGSV